jgi:glycerophosphoryl diester phosphodiesterase
MTVKVFNLQGHRGARGLAPENTLPAFERAFDLGVTSVETDVHLTRDGVPVLAHDPDISDQLCRLTPGSASPDPARRPLIRHLTLAELCGYVADRNPDPLRFPDQRPVVTPVASWYMNRHNLHGYTPPTLADLFGLWRAYIGPPIRSAIHAAAQAERVRRVVFDLELKRVPGRPETIGDDFDGQEAGELERRVLAVVQEAGVLGQTVMRSFDHRSVLALRRLEPRLTTAVLVAHTAPVRPVELVRAADAQIYCPDVNFLDEAQVRQLHAAGVPVLPWTVNKEAIWERLLAWGVDGITTDFPDRLADFLRRRGVVW